jgi:hypothetical protein
MTDSQIIAMLKELDAEARKQYPFTGLQLYGPLGKLPVMVEIVKQCLFRSDNHK